MDENQQRLTEQSDRESRDCTPVESRQKPSVRLRAICSIHRACVSGMIPAICTSRVARRMTKKNVVTDPTKCHPDLHREEVTGRHQHPVCAQKLFPGGAGAAVDPSRPGPQKQGLWRTKSCNATEAGGDVLQESRSGVNWLIFRSLKWF